MGIQISGVHIGGGGGGGGKACLNPLNMVN